MQTTEIKESRLTIPASAQRMQLTCFHYHVGTAITREQHYTTVLTTTPVEVALITGMM